MSPLIKTVLATVFLVAVTLPAEAITTLVVKSATDTAAIQPVIEDFETLNPGIHVDYHELESNDLDRQFHQAYANHTSTADIIISPAMDLQTRLVNDGYAQTYQSRYTASLPAWAKWRNQAFGFTFEPVVMAYSKAAFRGHTLPLTHAALARQLREHPDFYRGKVGTYDVRASGLGYLFATQDAVQSSTSARLLESLGRSDVKTYCCTSDVLNRLDKGTLVLGYNLLGSYALAQAEKDPRIGIIVPQDYTLVMSRVAFISARAKHVNAARRFIDFLLSPAGQHVIANSSALIAIRPDIQAPMSASSIRKRYDSSFQPIPLGPGLLVYLDQMKRAHYLEEWESMILPLGPVHTKEGRPGVVQK